MSAFAFRRAEEADLPAMMAIVRSAQAYLAAQGIDQWQDGYPQQELLAQDIAHGNAYVLTGEGGVCGMTVVVLDGEPDYDKIYEGAWRTAEPYGCIHRVAVRADQRGQGTADALMRGAEAVILEAGIPGVRIDTHRENLVMQRMLQRNGYAPCGTIYLKSGAERIALDKILKA